MSDEVLRVAVPPERSLSGVSVAHRELAFDLKRTLTAFGAPPTSVTTAALKRHVAAASRSIVSDCSQMDKRPCARLGWRAYVWIEPVSVTATSAVVRANVSWAARDGTPAGPGSAAPAPAFLAGFSAKLHLARDVDGIWCVDEQLETVAG